MNSLTTQRGNNLDSKYTTRSTVVERTSTPLSQATSTGSLDRHLAKTPTPSLTNRDPNISKSIQNQVTPLNCSRLSTSISHSHTVKGIPTSNSPPPSGTIHFPRLPSSSSLLASLLQKDYHRRLNEQVPGASEWEIHIPTTGPPTQTTVSSSQPLDLQGSTTTLLSPHPNSDSIPPCSTSPGADLQLQANPMMIGVLSAATSDDEEVNESVEVVSGEGKGDNHHLRVTAQWKDGSTRSVVDSPVGKGPELAESGAYEAMKGSGAQDMGCEKTGNGDEVSGLRGQRKGPLSTPYGDSSVGHMGDAVGESHISGSDNSESHQIKQARSSSSLSGEYQNVVHHPQPHHSNWAYPATQLPDRLPPPVASTQSIPLPDYHRSVVPSGNHHYSAHEQQHIVPVVERGGLLYHAYPYPIQPATLPNGSNGLPYSSGYIPAPSQFGPLLQAHSPQPTTYHTPWQGYQGNSPLHSTGSEYYQSDQHQGYYQHSSPLGTPSEAPTSIAPATLSSYVPPYHSNNKAETPHPSIQTLDVQTNTNTQPYTPSLSPINSTDEDDQSMDCDRNDDMPTGYPTRSQLGHGMPDFVSGVGGSRAPSKMIEEERNESNATGEATPVDMTEYEKERLANIKTNDMMMASLGLGSQGQAPSTYGSPRYSGKRKPSTVNLKANPNEKRKKTRSRQSSIAPVRTSTRIASMSRTVSYANLAGGSDLSDSADDSFSSRGEEAEEDWEGSDQSGVERRKGGPRSNAGKHRSWGGGKTKPRTTSFNDPTLRDLVDDHPDVRDVYPLFYHTCSPEMLITNDAFPLIGSVPSTCTPVEKAEFLRGFYHKGRRCIAQLDGFTARCEKKYDGPGHRWKELDYAMKIAIRDIRRKGVERCENYKYTRRDLLNRALGKNKWQPIEDDWMPWTTDSLSKDPAGDLNGFVLLEPPPHPAHPRLPRADPLMQGLQQPIISASARSKSRKRSAKVNAEVVSTPQGWNEPVSRPAGTHSQNPGGQFLDFQVSSPSGMQVGYEEADSEIDVDEEEARLEEERQQQLAIQQSLQQYDHSGFQPPIQIQTSYGMYSSIRGGDEASAGSGSMYASHNFGGSGPTPIPQSATANGAYQHLKVESQNVPLSSHSTYSHPLSSTHSHHELMEQGMGMMSGGIDMSFPIEGSADGQGMPDVPLHGYQSHQPQLPFQVGAGTIYGNAQNYNQAAQQQYTSMQSGQWQG